MVIMLLKCQGCWRVLDNVSMQLGCDDCYGRMFKQVNPTKMNVIKWFLANPKKVIKLLIQDFRGK